MEWMEDIDEVNNASGFMCVWWSIDEDVYQTLATLVASKAAWNLVGERFVVKSSDSMEGTVNVVRSNPLLELFTTIFLGLISTLGWQP